MAKIKQSDQRWTPEQLAQLAAAKEEVSRVIEIFDSLEKRIIALCSREDMHTVIEEGK